MNTHISEGCCRGPLISIEGINGVGKTYLTGLVLDTFDAGQGPPVVLEEFSARSSEGDLGRSLLGALKSAAVGDFFLRGGTPLAEAMLLAAIKMVDLDMAESALAQGRTVIEGRGLHTTAAYQATILHPGYRGAAHGTARELLAVFAEWRPLPDLTILITDDPDAATERVYTRSGVRLASPDRQIQHDVAWMYERLAEDDPYRIRILDRRRHDPAEAVSQIRDWIDGMRERPLECLTRPGSGRCRLRCGRTPAAPAAVSLAGAGR